jgi:hypothetical protein
MKRIILLLILSVGMIVSSYSQIKLDDFGRIVINTYLPNNLQIPSEAKRLLETKLNEITSVNGMGGSQVNPRFIITASVNVITKDILAGTIPKTAQRINVTLFVGDAINNTVFSTTNIILMGVGVNENKSFISAFNSINSKNKEVAEFIEVGKNKIVSYYAAECDLITKEVETLVIKQNFDEAIYKLALIPKVCKDCYISAQKSIQDIYQQKINYCGNELLNKAKALWAAEQNPTGATKAGELLNQINQYATCYPNIKPFIKTMEMKITEDEKQQWQFEMKQYSDNLELEKKQRENDMILEKDRINAWRQIAAEYAKNQPKTVEYTYIIW